MTGYFQTTCHGSQPIEIKILSRSTYTNTDPCEYGNESVDSIKAENFLVSWATHSSPRMIQIHEVRHTDSASPYEVLTAASIRAHSCPSIGSSVLGNGFSLNLAFKVISKIFKPIWLVLQIEHELTVNYWLYWKMPHTEVLASDEMNILCYLHLL
jgi:hypothetical protein